MSSSFLPKPLIFIWTSKLQTSKLCRSHVHSSNFVKTTWNHLKAYATNHVIQRSWAAKNAAETPMNSTSCMGPTTLDNIAVTCIRGGQHITHVWLMTPRQVRSSSVLKKSGLRNENPMDPKKEQRLNWILHENHDESWDPSLAKLVKHQGCSNSMWDGRAHRQRLHQGMTHQGLRRNFDDIDLGFHASWISWKPLREAPWKFPTPSIWTDWDFNDFNRFHRIFRTCPRIRSWKKIVYVLSVRKGPRSCHVRAQVLRKISMGSSRWIGKLSWPWEKLFPKTSGLKMSWEKKRKNPWGTDGRSMVLGPVILLEDPSSVLLDLIFQEKALKKSYKASHIFSWTPWNSAHSNKFPWHWFNHAREKIGWLTPLQLYFPTLQRIAQRASIFIAFFSHADWHIGSNRLLQSGRLILGKVIAQCEARQSHQDILRVWRWKTCESSFDSKWLWTFIVKGGMSHIVTFYHAESQITKSISRLQTEVWIIDSWNITSSWHPVSLTVASGSCDLIILMSFKSMGLVEQTSRVSCGSCSINFGDPEILENPVVKVVRNLIIWYNLRVLILDPYNIIHLAF